MDLDFERAAGRTATQIALDALLDAVKPYSENEYVDPNDLGPSEPPITWPSTIDYIDTQCGGFYGMATVAAEYGTGKSLLALGSALAAAASRQWQVVYLPAEDDLDGLAERFNLQMEAHPELLDCVDRFYPLAVGKGQTPESLTLDIHHAVNPALDLPVLIVMDSINSIVNLNPQLPYLQGIARFGLWAMAARRASRGRASFLLTSETNTRGEAKGANLSFWSDQYLLMKKAGEHSVEMTLKKTRRTKGEGPMGKYLRIWTRQRFERPPVSSTLRVVNGEPDEFSLADPEPETEDFL